MGFKDKTGLKILPGSNPLCPQRGPYEASEGIYPVMGNEKTAGLTEARDCLDRFNQIRYSTVILDKE